MTKIDIDRPNLIYHPDRTSEWKKNRDCFPIYIEVGPTNRCNHKCVFCALDFLEHKGYDIDKGVMLKTLEDVVSHGIKSIMFAGEGEPLLHKYTPLFIKKARESGLCVSVTTNGVPFTEKKAEQCLPYLTWIRFSIDAGTRGTYSKIHRTKPEDFDKVIDNIKKSITIKNRENLKVNISCQFLAIPNNIAEASKLAEIVRDVGVDNLQIKPYSQHPNSINKFVVNYQNYKHLGDELKKFNLDNFEIKFREENMERLKEKPKYNSCLGSSFFALIDAKGNVIPCNLFYDKPDFTYGNLYQNSFSEIWKSEKRKEVLKRLEERSIEKCRESCRLDPTNRFLYELINIPDYLNFI